MSMLRLSLALLQSLAVGAVLLDMPPRFMWGWEPKTSGYCGSVSLQTAAIFHGNWLTTDYIRGTSGGHNGKHELLIGYERDLATKGTSVLSACAALQMNCTMWDYHVESTPQHAKFLEWATAALVAGHPVIIGLYWGVESDAEYDHIVPLVGLDSSSVWFNDLYSNTSIKADLSSFITNRTQCNRPVRFGPGSFCLPDNVNYGMVVTGNKDLDQVLLPVKLAMSSWTEPDYSKEDQQHQAPTTLSATVTVSELIPGTRYALLRFDHVDDVPIRNFLNSKFSHKIEFEAVNSKYLQHTSFMSNSTTLFRCVALNN